MSLHPVQHLVRVAACLSSAAFQTFRLKSPLIPLAVAFHYYVCQLEAIRALHTMQYRTLCV